MGPLPDLRRKRPPVTTDQEQPVPTDPHVIDALAATVKAALDKLRSGETATSVVFAHAGRTPLRADLHAKVRRGVHQLAAAGLTAQRIAEITGLEPAIAQRLAGEPADPPTAAGAQHRDDTDDLDDEHDDTASSEPSPPWWPDGCDIDPHDAARIVGDVRRSLRRAANPFGGLVFGASVGELRTQARAGARRLLEAGLPAHVVARACGLTDHGLRILMLGGEQ